MLFDLLSARLKSSSQRVSLESKFKSHVNNVDRLATRCFWEIAQNETQTFHWTTSMRDSREIDVSMDSDTKIQRPHDGLPGEILGN